MSDLPPCETDHIDRCFERAFGSPTTWRIAAGVAIALLTFSAAHGRGVKRPAARFICERYEPAGRSILGYGCHWERAR